MHRITTPENFPELVSAALAHVIRHEVIRKGLSISRLAKATGISPNTCYKRLDGRLGPFTVPELASIAAALGTTATNLLAAAERAAALTEETA